MSLSTVAPADAFYFSLDYVDNLNGSIDEPVEDGDTALHLACLYGYLPCVQVSVLLLMFLPIGYFGCCLCSSPKIL